MMGLPESEIGRERRGQQLLGPTELLALRERIGTNPITGPMNTDAENTDIALPRPTASQVSAKREKISFRRSPSSPPLKHQTHPQ